MSAPTTSAPLIGWPLLPKPDVSGRLHYPTLDQSVRELIRVILLTRPGEQLMRPEFGGGLENYLHEPNTLTTRRRIRDLIAEALEQWERRIDVEQVDVWEVPEKPTRIRVEISYRVRRTRAPGQVGMLMDLEA